jgi:hypothetical protein
MRSAVDKSLVLKKKIIAVEVIPHIVVGVGLKPMALVLNARFKNIG